MGSEQSISEAHIPLLEYVPQGLSLEALLSLRDLGMLSSLDPFAQFFLQSLGQAPKSVKIAF